MSKKNNRKQYTARRQRNAERKQQKKVNRLTANVRKARQMEREIFHNSAETEMRSPDTGFDPRTHQVITIASLLEEGLETHIAVARQGMSNDEIGKIVSGVAMTHKDCVGTVALTFPPSWDVEKVKDKISSDVWAYHIMDSIERHPGGIIVGDGEDYAKFLDDMAGSFLEWIADCGEAPNEHGIVEVDVNSSAISHVAYDANDSTMTVTFSSGSRYEYAGVPRKRFCGLVSADSVGRYFHRNIRDTYAYKRVA